MVLARRAARTGLRIAAPVLLAYTATVATGCTSPSSDADAPASKVVLFAIDAATWSVLDPLFERGMLPNIERLRDGGAASELASIQPSSSPVIWTSIATGKAPEKHGITAFVRFPDGDPGNPAPVTRTMRRGKALWNILGDTLREVAVVGWFVTWPPEEVRGVLVSDHAHFGDPIETIFPPGYLGKVKATTNEDVTAAMPEFMSYDFDPTKLDRESDDPEERLNFLVYDRFVRAYGRDDYYKRISAQLLKERVPDFLAVYLRGTDDVQHGFWKFMEPEHFDGVTEDQEQRFGRVIEAYWRWTDQAIGELLAFYENENPLILLVSDHGAGPAVGEFAINTPEYLHLSGSHRDQGILIANGPGVRKGATVEGAMIYDVTPTILRYLGEPLAKDMDGKPLDALFTGAITDRPIEWVETYDDPADSAAVDSIEHPTSDDDPEILDHLKSLGYID
jgi:predicted AlkP superfamily phosphohydrolase/phosphomutase